MCQRWTLRLAVRAVSTTQSSSLGTAAFCFDTSSASPSLHYLPSTSTSVSTCKLPLQLKHFTPSVSSSAAIIRKITTLSPCVLASRFAPERLSADLPPSKTTNQVSTFLLLPFDKERSHTMPGWKIHWQHYGRECRDSGHYDDTTSSLSRDLGLYHPTGMALRPNKDPLCHRTGICSGVTDISNMRNVRT